MFLRRCVLAVTYPQRIAIGYGNIVEWRDVPYHPGVVFLFPTHDTNLLAEPVRTGRANRHARLEYGVGCEQAGTVEAVHAASQPVDVAMCPTCSLTEIVTKYT